MATRIGVDIGGTFTDLVVFDDATGRVTVEKVSTTPAAPEVGCVEAVRKAERGGVIAACDYFLHGTTVGLNALLERRGAVVGLLCTEGFRDSLELRRGSRVENGDLFQRPPPPLVPRHLRLPVRERMNAQGEVLRAPDPQSVRDALALFTKHEVTSIAVCFMNAYVNPAHEIETARILRAEGFAGDISLSHRISREYRDYERASTTTIDAFVRTRMADYLEGVRRGITGLGFAGTCLITRSGGGSMSFDDAKERSFETIMSGPVAGAEGAAELARQFGLGDLVTGDVGGTSFDTALILDGRPQLLYQGEIAGLPIQAPWVDVRSIGAGGGSIAHIDVGGLLQVGPQSAGADPGPACYGRGGTKATVTDAAFFLGMLGSGRFASGLALSREKAEAALKAVAAPLGSTVTDTAIGIVTIASANMANAIREITIERGIDPRGLKLLAFGGAGPMLATQVARELDIQSIVVPPYAGNFSAWGLLGSDLIRSAARTRLFHLTNDEIEALDATADEMFRELERHGDDEHFLEGSTRELSLAMRFSGQEHSLTIPAALRGGRLALSAQEISAAFREAYLRSFGIVLESPVEVIGLRTLLRKPLPRTARRAPDQPAKSQPQGVPETHALHSFATGEESVARIVQRSSLRRGEQHDGPAVIYEETATTYVDVDFGYGLDENGCLRLQRKQL
jgi:N-methylhydantoinase A